MGRRICGFVALALALPVVGGLSALAEESQPVVVDADFAKEAVYEDENAAAKRLVGWRWRVELTVLLAEGKPPPGWLFDAKSPTINDLVTASARVPKWFLAGPFEDGLQKVALVGYVPDPRLADVPKWKLLKELKLKAWVEEEEDDGDGPFVRVLRVEWTREYLGSGRLHWELALEVEKRPTSREIGWWFSGAKLRLLMAHTTPPPRWKILAYGPTRAKFGIGGVHESEHVDTLLKYTKFAWKKDVQVRAGRVRNSTWRRPDNARPERWPPEFESEPPDVPLGPDSRLEHRESVEFIDRWDTERKDMEARVLRCLKALDDLSDGDKKDSASRLIQEAEGLLEQSGPALKQVQEEVERGGIGLRLADRLRINTFHFKVHRLLKMIERILIGVLPRRPASGE